jgi:acyl dehydratase
MSIRVGASAVYKFIVQEDDMRLFERLSNDRSSVHTDDSFARKRGFERAIVYGGIMIAHLSHVLGTMIPGDRGTSVQWRIDYRKPLYIQEPAVITMWVTDVSAGTGIVDCQFEIATDDRTVATGSTRSIVPREDLSEED